MKRVNDVYLSERVGELLRDDSLTRIIQHVRDELNQEWLATAPLENAERELIYHELHALDRVETMLKAVVSDLLFQRGDNQ